MTEDYDIEKQYQLYLERMKLDESTMHPIQKSETKRAFFGAWGQLLILQSDVSELANDDILIVHKRMFKQVRQFWLNEQINKN